MKRHAFTGPDDDSLFKEALLSILDSNNNEELS